MFHYYHIFTTKSSNKIVHINATAFLDTEKDAKREEKILRSILTKKYSLTSEDEKNGTYVNAKYGIDIFVKKSAIPNKWELRLTYIDFEMKKIAQNEHLELIKKNRNTEGL